MSDNSISKPVHMSVNVTDRMIDFTDVELLSRLGNFEDHFVERKSSADSKDWLKTAVAFSNSVPIGYPAILFVGVKNDGTIEGNSNLDSLQQSFSRIVDNAYPSIYYTSRIISRDGKQCLAIIIPGSALRPHFAGKSYVRIGSETKNASETQFANLISQRSGKAYEILKWQGKQVTVQFAHIELIVNATSQRKQGERVAAVITECNQFYVKVQLQRGDTAKPMYSYPLAFVEISFDDAKDRLELVFTRHVD